MNTNTAIMADGGRNASRARRAQLVQGKAALPQATERKRNGEHRNGEHNGSLHDGSPAGAMATAPMAPAVVATKPAAVEVPKPIAAEPSISMRGGRDASRARRAALVQGKAALRQMTPPATAGVETHVASATNTTSAPTTSSNSLAAASRQIAQAMRNARARNGRGDAAPARPSGRARNATPLNYAPKVTVSETYAGSKVTGVRIGRGMNITGDERGASVQVTGSQYIGRETGFQPRAGGVKVGVQRTAGGLTVTGTQVRSKVSITGDEYASGTRITGEADPEIGDDLLDRRESGAYTSMQFQRQHNPHGHTVFGTNLGRSAKSVGSRERDRERAIEQTQGGLPISGTALGRSVRVTGDEDGSCRAITGDQYLMPANKQPLCAMPEAQPRARAGAAMGMNGGMNGRPDPVTGEKVTVSESWTRLHITGVDVEHNTNVTGDEYGVCSPITGTPYVGPGQYESFCATGDVNDAARVVTPGMSAGNRVTGDTPKSVKQVTGTQRGAERVITGTPYYRDDVEGDMKTNVIERVNKSFSVRSPQRDSQLRAGVAATEAPSAESHVTGSFAVGHGKITGNQEFHFSPRPKGERAGRVQVTGEGRVEGSTVTGSAWSEHGRVTGTEDYIASERNPSERAGKPHAFAGSALFKGKGRHEERRQNVTGMAGWSAKTAARVTLSGGAQG